MNYLALLSLLITTISADLSEVPAKYYCDNGEILGLRIENCLQPFETQLCTISKDKSLPIEIDFSFNRPNTNTSDVTFWVSAPFNKIPERHFGTALSYGTHCTSLGNCPLIPNEKNTIKSHLYLDPAMSVNYRGLPIIRTIWNLIVNGNESKEHSQCAFLVNFHIV